MDRRPCLVALVLASGCLISNPLYGGALETDGGTTAEMVESPPVGSTSDASGGGGATTSVPPSVGSTSGAEDEDGSSSSSAGSTTADGCVPSPEVCDGVDNDCDGSTDEWSVDNESCNGCKLMESNGHGYAFCSGKQTWFDARAECAKHGADLVVIDDADENDFVAQSLEMSPGEYFWTGLNELAQEGEWVWVDGTALDYDAFAFGEPNDIGGDQDCVVTSEGAQWFDLHCGNDSPNVTASGWVCEHPDP